MAQKPDYKALSAIPGPDGSLWRLLDAWKIDGIDNWLKGEAARGVDAMTLGPTFGRALAVATMHAARNFSDREAFIANERSGVGHAYAKYLKLLVEKAGAFKTPGGVIVPPYSLN